ncbi:MAG: phosphoglucomutase/phosphomannomutase family protein [Saccharofermentanales bacterium]
MIKFGTGGWRAIIADGFTRENVELLSQAISETGVKEIVIGYDRRFLSDIAAGWAACVLAANGVKVHLITKISPTPLIMFAVKTLGTEYGLAVTASHNPAIYNGVKVFTEGGQDARAEVTAMFEEMIASGITVKKMEFDKAVAQGLIVRTDMTNQYLDSIISMIDMDSIRRAKLKVLLDPMYGVSKTSLQTILMTARCEVDIINDRHDTLFGGKLPSPSASTLGKLRDMVIDQGYDMGIGTDGDADRIGIIDDEGDFIHPNKIMVLLYYYLLHYKGWRGDVVRNIATTHVLDRIAEDHGQKCHEVPVGFKHISSKMEQTDAVIGGESSGGLTIRGHIKGKDGIFAACLLVEMISVTGKKISQILNEIAALYGSAEMTEFDSSFSPEKKEELVKRLFVDKTLPEFGKAISGVDHSDGCKVRFVDGSWIIARFSGTEPLLRIFCEAADEAEAGRLTDIWRKDLGI